MAICAGEGRVDRLDRARSAWLVGERRLTVGIHRDISVDEIRRVAERVGQGDDASRLAVVVAGFLHEVQRVAGLGVVHLGRNGRPEILRESRQRVDKVDKVTLEQLCLVDGGERRQGRVVVVHEVVGFHHDGVVIESNLREVEIVGRPDVDPLFEREPVGCIGVVGYGEEHVEESVAVLSQHHDVEPIGEGVEHDIRVRNEAAGGDAQRGPEVGEILLEQDIACLVVDAEHGVDGFHDLGRPGGDHVVGRQASAR